MIRTIAFSFAALISSCVPKECAPPTISMPESSVEQKCEDTISWDGRLRVHVVRESTNSQTALDNGNAVNMGYSGHDFVAGHYSSHGAIFRSGPNLSNGDVINYDCRSYTVTGRTSASYGDYWIFRAGLTVLYSGCGGVCLVFAE